LASLEPRVIDAWLAFEAVEPEAFHVGESFQDSQSQSGLGETGPRGGGLLDAGDAARRMAQRLKL